MSLQELIDVGATGRSPGGNVDHRNASRQIVPGDVWLIDHHAGDVVHCSIVDVSAGGIALRVPIGHGVRVARRYELCSRLQGSARPFVNGMIVSRRATVVRTDYLRGGGDTVLVALRFDHPDALHTPYRLFSPASVPV